LVKSKIKNKKYHTVEKCNVPDGIWSWNSRIVRHRFTNWAKGDLY
jgi:hypothetical protein